MTRAEVGKRAKNDSALQGYSSRSPGSTSLDRVPKTANLSKSPSYAEGQSSLFGKMIDTVIVGDSVDLGSKGQQSQSLFPNLIDEPIDLP